MTRGQYGWIEVSVGLAKTILRERPQRRRVLAQGLMVSLALMAVGLWGIDNWLMQGVWRFFLWWGACALVTLSVFLLAIYDALAVIREERKKVFGDLKDE